MRIGNLYALVIVVIIAGAGVIGGVFCKRAISTTRTIKITQLLIRRTM